MESAESVFCKYFLGKQKKTEAGFGNCTFDARWQFLHRVTVWMVLKKDAYPFILLAMKNA